MSKSPIVTPVAARPSPTPVREPSALVDAHGRSRWRESTESISAIEGAAAVNSAGPPHRRCAAALIRQLSGRTEAALGRELDRFFAGRPELSQADRAAIARAMARFRNELLHQPRSALRAAADAGGSPDPHPLLDAARRVFGLAAAPIGIEVAPRRPENRRPARSQA